jgi:hypothetical protein
MAEAFRALSLNSENRRESESSPVLKSLFPQAE